MKRISTEYRNLELVERMLNAGVEPIVIGSTALTIYGCRDPQEVNDLDLFIKPDEYNETKMIKILYETGYSVSELVQKLRFPDKHLNLSQTGSKRFGVDIFTPEGRFSFDEMLGRAEVCSLDNVEVPVASQSDLKLIYRFALEREVSDKAKCSKIESDLRRLEAV